MAGYLDDDAIREVLHDVRNTGGEATIAEFDHHYGEAARLLRWILIPRYVIESDGKLVLTPEGESCAAGRPLLRWPINLEPDGSVVTIDGEVLEGTWELDAEDHAVFTSESGVRISHPMVRLLCEQIQEWRKGLR